MADYSKMTQAELIAELERVKATRASGGKLSLKVGVKGGVSLYGMGRFPVTLYASQWEKLQEFIGTGAITEFIKANEAIVTRKEA